MLLVWYENYYFRLLSFDFLTDARLLLFLSYAQDGILLIKFPSKC